MLNNNNITLSIIRVIITIIFYTYLCVQLNADKDEHNDECKVAFHFS